MTGESGDPSRSDSEGNDSNQCGDVVVGQSKMHDLTNDRDDLVKKRFKRLTGYPVFEVFYAVLVFCGILFGILICMVRWIRGML